MARITIKIVIDPRTDLLVQNTTATNMKMSKMKYNQIFILKIRLSWQCAEYFWNKRKIRFILICTLKKYYLALF